MDAGDRLQNLAVSDTGFLVDPVTGFTFSVNATGRAILDLPKQGRDADGVQAALAERFETGEGDDLDRTARRTRAGPPGFGSEAPAGTWTSGGYGPRRRPVDLDERSVYNFTEERLAFGAHVGF